MLVVIVSACCVFVRVMITRRRMEMFGFGYLPRSALSSLVSVIRWYVGLVRCPSALYLRLENGFLVSLPSGFWVLCNLLSVDRRPYARACRSTLSYLSPCVRGGASGSLWLWSMIP